MSRLGQTAYEAYANQRGWATYDGQNMPSWEDVDPGICTAWESAAMAVLDSFETVAIDPAENPGQLTLLFSPGAVDVKSPEDL